MGKASLDGIHLCKHLGLGSCILQVQKYSNISLSLREHLSNNQVHKRGALILVLSASWDTLLCLS